MAISCLTLSGKGRGKQEMLWSWFTHIKQAVVKMNLFFPIPCGSHMAFFFPRATSINVWDLVPFPFPTHSVWSPEYIVKWVVMVPEGGQTVAAVSTSRRAKREMSVIVPFITMRF